MSWASRRRFLYLTGVILFFAVVLGVPFAMWWYEPARCDDGTMNGGETAVDRGGPCRLLDERALVPHAIQWARAFPVRDGTWSAVAYVENPNDAGGVIDVPYRFKLYDDRNILVAEQEGSSYIMPGAVTPIFVGGIDTGNRIVARTYFEFAAPLVWERMKDTSRVIDVTGKTTVDETTTPRLTALVHNTSVVDAKDVQFVAIVYDSSGNAIAASRTEIPRLTADQIREIIFTWPDPFVSAVGRLDVIPLRSPESAVSRRGFF